MPADIQHYTTVKMRNRMRAARKMLKFIEAVEVLGSFGTTEEQPLNSTDTVVWRRLNPWNMGANGTPQITATDFVLQEGVTPDTNTISYTDVEATLQQYGVLFKFSSKVELMYEDNIPQDMVKVTSNTLAEVAELIRYGVLKGGTSVDYANGTTRAGINSPINLNMLRRIARTLEVNRAMRITTKLSAGPDYDTSAIEAGWLVFHHTDMMADIRNLEGYIPTVKYATGRQIHPRESGAVEDFRFISSPLFAPFLAAGAAVGATGMKAANATNIDVYPFIVLAEDAFGHVALKGRRAIQPRVLSATDISHSNPMGMFGYVGASMWTQTVRLNENFMVRGEAAVSSLA